MKMLDQAQRGIALITVMLILAIATVAVVSMSSARQLDIRRTENQLRSMQAWEYAYGLESWAVGRLAADAKVGDVDGLDDTWSEPLARTTVAGGTMQAKLDDLQGRINLNNLLVEGKVSAPDVKRLERLLAVLKLKTELAQAIVDWIDADMDASYPHGAEDETYTRSKPAYRAANRQFADVSELLLVKGMTREIYSKLLPYVYVVEGYAPLNINTASAMVLRCLADDISADRAASMFRARGKPFAKVAEFLKDEAVADAGIGKYGLGVSSQNFLLQGQIDMGKTHLQFQSQLQRDSGGAQVVKRQRQGLAHG
ncbi:general secretion pathway protein GspK [Methylomonas sp. LW13]|uniref:type II secretion system minor pseudopilin GspK n=1 Tax=unclassified Methylomonas TaxID=2608980 RepID=UPI00051B1D4F|nr:type II secretion system minor pseudopilin GspK [Methylomonas sp. LW13]QBC26994.1 general secretion pathway protein GspK [Methylomonas sp. LW13]